MAAAQQIPSTGGSAGQPAPPQGCRVCPTRGVCTARDLSDGELDALSGYFHTTPILQRNDHLYRMSDTAGSVFVVRSGVFKTVTVSTTGEETVTGFHYPGELVGFSGQATGAYVDSALALGPSTACRLKIDQLPRLFAIGTSGTSLLQMLAEREENDRLLEINLRQSKAEVRIAGFLCLLMRRLERLGYTRTQLPMPMSRTDLANHLGLTLECVSRVLGKWRRAGVLSIERNCMQLQQPAELETLACHLD